MNNCPANYTCTPTSVYTPIDTGLGFLLALGGIALIIVAFAIAYYLYVRANRGNE